MEKIGFHPSDFVELQTLLEKETGEPFQVAPTLGGGVWLKSKSSELMLGTYYGKKLVMKRIHFEPQRQGIGTKVVNWLQTFAKTKGFENLVIESATTSMIINFAKKHGFQKILHSGIELDNEFFGNWGKTIT